MANTWNESGTTWSTGRWGTTDAIASGWGADAWNTGGSWGQATDELVSLTGVSATTSVGDVISGANQGWGRAGWSEEPYGESDNPVVTLTSQSVTTSLGDLEAFNETGWGRLGWGDADWDEAADETVSITGVEATSSLGTAVQGIGVPLEMIPDPPTGTELLKIMRGQVGEIEIGIGVELTGIQSNFATPTLSYVGTLVGWGRDGWNDNSWGESPNQVLNIVGVDATTSVGSISPADVVGLSGQEATTNIGSVTFTIDSTPAVTGQEASGEVGTLGLEFGPPSITGVSATVNVGELTIDDAQIMNITGVQSTSAVGSIVTQISVPLTGIAATSSIGSVIAPDVIGLTGLQATFVDPTIGIQAYKNVDTGSNDSFSNVDSGSNTSYSDESIGSNSSLSNVATGSNTSYSDAA